ncbi:hypothetical protein [Sphingomonas oryzagri]
MIRSTVGEKVDDAPPRIRILELLRDGPPEEAVAREELGELIASLDPRSRRLLRTDPSLARALWLLDLARIRDRETRRASARCRIRQYLITLAALSAGAFFLLTLTITLGLAHKAQENMGGNHGLNLEWPASGESLAATSAHHTDSAPDGANGPVGKPHGRGFDFAR